MNLANKITFTRFLFYWLALILVFYGCYGLALGFLGLALAGDVLDGAVARRLGQTTRFGGTLDFLVDKALNTIAVIVLTWSNSVPINFPAWVALAMIVQANFQFMLWLLFRFFAEAPDEVKTPRTFEGRLIFGAQSGAIVIIILWNALGAALPGTGYVVAMVGVATIAITLRDLYVWDYSAIKVR